MRTRVMYLGEIVGKAGIYAAKTLVPKLRQEREIDFVIANGEGATGGFGLGKNHSIYLHKLGIDVITGGECLYYKKDMVGHINGAPYILRPANYPPSNPGRGWRTYSKGDKSIGVISLLGQSGFNRVHLSNPFTFVPELVRRVKMETKNVIIDFHAGTTAEKYTMFYHMDGEVSAVLGSHTKVLTADEQVLPGGTAVICDTGRTGSQNSVGGLAPDVEVRKFLRGVPERSKDVWSRLELQGVILEIDDDGKAVSIERLRVPCDNPEEKDE